MFECEKKEIVHYVKSVKETSPVKLSQRHLEVENLLYITYMELRDQRRTVETLG
jgi:hypothetical protein